MVYLAEPNYLEQPAAIQNEFTINTSWGLNGTDGIDAVSAWDITTGSKNVRVGIIDSGIANHPDLNDNIVSGWDIVNDNDVTTDDTAYHGTAVAGIIGAVGNSSVRVGVNWDVSLVPIQASKTDAIFSLADCVKAVKWAKDKWGTSEQIDIINFSVGEFGISTAVRDMVKDYQRFVCLVSR